MQVLETANLFFSGILAGMEIAAHYGFRKPAAMLDTKPQIILRQGLVRKIRWLIPLFFLPTLLTGLMLAVISSGTCTLLLRLVALAALCIWMCIRIIGTVKINAASLDWDPDSPPADWREHINKAEQYHTTGTWVTVVAFVCFLIGS